MKKFSAKKEKKTEHSDKLLNKGTPREPIKRFHATAQSLESAKVVSENNGWRQQYRTWNSSKNKITVEGTALLLQTTVRHCFLSVWNKLCHERSRKLRNRKLRADRRPRANALHERFYAEIKNKYGEDYEPDSLKVMITSLDRHLKNKDFKLSLVRAENAVRSSRRKSRQLRLVCPEKRPNKARQVSEEKEEEIFWKSEKLCLKIPRIFASDNGCGHIKATNYS